MDVGILFDNTGKGGGNYNQSVIDSIRAEFSVETHEILRPNRYRLINFCLLYLSLINLSGTKDTWIRTANAIITMPFDKTKGKNIAIIHHIGTGGKSTINRIAIDLLDKLLVKNLKHADKIVVVSQYWKNYFEALGYDSLEVIYNPFNFQDFQFHEKELSEFKEKYHLMDKPIIYMGNCQKSKGVVETYGALKDLNAHFVTSGIKDVNLPTLHLNVDYKEYLKLLQVSSVAVTMSKFNEGWCRTAHEAMLCKTPVIGSGKGGMGELLTGGNQIICQDFSRLPNLVESALDDRNLGEAGYMFATQECFSYSHFKNKWLELLRSF